MSATSIQCQASALPVAGEITVGDPGSGKLHDGIFPFPIVEVPNDNPEGWKFGPYSMCPFALTEMELWDMIGRKTLLVSVNGADPEAVALAATTRWKFAFGGFLWVNAAAFFDSGSGLLGLFGVADTLPIGGNVPDLTACYYWQGRFYPPIGIGYQNFPDSTIVGRSFEIPGHEHDGDNPDTGIMTYRGQSTPLFGPTGTGVLSIALTSGAALDA